MGEKVMENIDFLSSIWDVFVQFLLNNSGNMNNREKFVTNVFVENVIIRIFKKKSSKSVQGMSSYGQNSGENLVPENFILDSFC